MAEPSRPTGSLRPGQPDPLAEARSRVIGAQPLSTPPSAPAPGKDWPGQAADLIVDKVDLVRSKTTGPILTAARAVVFGIVAVVLGVMAAILLLIGLVRVLDTVLPSSVWAAYLLLGVVFALAGTFVFRKRKSLAPSAPTTRR
jgi:hypothetical protein